MVSMAALQGRVAKLALPASLRPRCQHRNLRTRAEAAESIKTDDEGVDSNTSKYCSIDASGKRVINKSLLEKENDFLEALQAYYYNGESKLNDDEFELLKDDLVWSGSQVAVLTSNEQRFLEAMRAYTRGSPILSDEEYDDLKDALVRENSVVTRAGPRCSIRSRRMYSDANPDYLKLTLLNLPAALLVLGFIFSIDDLTGFEITKAIQLPPPYSVLFLWGLVFPSIYILASSITNFILPDALILKADCPSCNTSNQAYFGGIFTVAGNRESTTVECPKCLADLEFNAKRRSVLVRTSSEDKKKAEEEKKAKKAASAKKKAAKAAAKKEESSSKQEESKDKEEAKA